jgi:uncharacterized protein YhaN
MRLARLDLTRYGKFTDYVIDFGEAQPGSPDLHIVYGLNEAGKSTSLSAYLDLLYGIEERSRYNFLHAYNAMQVGGALEFNGETHELKRVKQRTNALLDGRGQPVAEAILSVPLAGISRDAYRTMFSLDDVTLEEGGNAILQSKGDLGELLFSASAGLGGVSATLSAISDEADSLYKKRARSTRIAELKQKLAELKARRDEIDTLASAHAAIVATLAQATTAYDEATTELGAMRARREAIARLLRARPLAAEYQRLTLELAARTALPRPPAEWARTLPSLMQEETRLSTQLAGNRTDIERVQDEIASIRLDDRLLSLSDRIGHLTKGQARFGSAEEDLPKRRTALVERQATIAAILARLGQSGCERPETLLLPAATVGALRDLIEIRSGVEATLQTATRELAAAKAALEAVDADRQAVVDAAQPETFDFSRLTTMPSALSGAAIMRRGFGLPNAACRISSGALTKRSGPFCRCSTRGQRMARRSALYRFPTRTRSRPGDQRRRASTSGSPILPSGTATSSPSKGRRRHASQRFAPQADRSTIPKPRGSVPCAMPPGTSMLAGSTRPVPRPLPPPCRPTT